MASLRDRIVAEIERREQTARKATSGQWCSDSVGDIYALRKPPVAAHVGEIDRAADAEHIALHDPADALRRYTHYRRLLDRHVIVDADTGAGDRQPHCRGCGYTPSADEDCPDVTDIADALGLPTTSDGSQP